ncbi:MAG: alpha/beta hydrolase [Saprospiraceae bacterium]
MPRSFILLLLSCLSFANCSGQMGAAVSKSDASETNYSNSKIIKMTNGQSLAYIEKGSGEQTLLMIHGLGNNSLAWKKMMENLQADFRCIAIDLPNYGLSQAADHPFTMSAFALTVQQFSLKMQLQNVVLIGHSMGGQIAMTTVLETDAPIRKMVLRRLRIRNIYRK